VTEKLTLDVSPEEIFNFIDSLPVRPSVDDLDYLAKLRELKDEVGDILVQNQEILRLRKANEIRGRFENASPDEILVEIEALPKETMEEISLASQLLAIYRNYAAANRPEIFDEKFAGELAAKLEAQLKDK
jgi:hypothetical protein